MTEASPKKSDLKVRVASAIVMLLVAGGAVWAKGPIFTGFIILLGIGLLWEWWGLISRISQDSVARIAWMIFGFGYIGWALSVAYHLWAGWQLNNAGPFLFIATAVMVVAVDVGAYFAGRAIGGPKIAPSISPSKTWAGLFGGMAAAIVWSGFAQMFGSSGRGPSTEILVMGAAYAILVAIVAQAGDFFESWLKRKAGVKDSGSLIPGHGGILDRLDGHLAAFAFLPLLVFAVGSVADALVNQ